MNGQRLRPSAPCCVQSLQLGKPWRQQTVPIMHTTAEKRSIYSINSRTRIAYHATGETISLKSTRFAPRLHTFAPCGVLLPPLAQNPKVALGPACANVANLLASPPDVGTSPNSGQGRGRGNSRAFRHSLFWLSGFPNFIISKQLHRQL
jgi:hypothetical protein